MLPIKTFTIKPSNAMNFLDILNSSRTPWDFPTIKIHQNPHPAQALPTRSALMMKSSEKQIRNKFESPSDSIFLIFQFIFREEISLR